MLGKDPKLSQLFEKFLVTVNGSNYYVQKYLNAFQQMNSEILKDESTFGELKDFFKSPAEFKLSPIWLDQISIFNFFNVEYIIWDKLNQPIGYEDIFTDIFLSLLIMIASLLYFVIAKENRAVAISNYKKLSTLRANKLKPIFEQNILNQLAKSKEYVFSKNLHSLSI